MKPTKDIGWRVVNVALCFLAAGFLYMFIQSIVSIRNSGIVG